MKMIPAHVIFADPNRFDLETLSNLYHTNKEWVSYCDFIKENVIKNTFDPYHFLHGVSITSSNTLFRLIPLKNYLQHILDLKEGRPRTFPKTIPNLLISKCKKMTMNEVFPTLVLLMKLQVFMVYDILDVPYKEVYPYQLLNVVLIFQALEKICIEHKFKELLDNKKFIQGVMTKCYSVLEEIKNKTNTMNRNTIYIYYHCVRYIRRMKRMLHSLKI